MKQHRHPRCPSPSHGVSPKVPQCCPKSSAPAPAEQAGSAEAAGRAASCGSAQKCWADATLSLCPLLTVAAVRVCRAKKREQTTQRREEAQVNARRHFYLGNASSRRRLVPSGHSRRCSGRTELRSAEGTAPLQHGTAQHSSALRKHPSSPAGEAAGCCSAIRSLPCQHFEADFSI